MFPVDSHSANKAKNQKSPRGGGARNSKSNKMFALSAAFTGLCTCLALALQWRTWIHFGSEDIDTLPPGISFSRKMTVATLVDGELVFGTTARTTTTRSGTNTGDKQVAMCHKSLYGPVDMQRVINWASYYYDLGFDQIFIWYIPEVESIPGFHDLQDLPFVTLVPNLLGKPKQYKHSYQMNREEPGNQLDDQQECLNKVAADYEWVMMADSDEFLWFRDRLGIREFLQQHAASATYLSFGKWMYTVRHGVETNRSLYDLNMNPFTGKSFCNGNIADLPHYRGSPTCPYFYGRCKLLIRPKAHRDDFRRDVHIHGRLAPDPEQGIIHFHTDMAHFKEWPGQFEVLPNRGSPGITMRPPQDYAIFNTDQLGIHSFARAHAMNTNGTYNMYYDQNLEPWLDFVATRRNATIDQDKNASDTVGSTSDN